MSARSDTDPHRGPTHVSPKKFRWGVKMQFRDEDGTWVTAVFHRLVPGTDLAILKIKWTTEVRVRAASLRFKYPQDEHDADDRELYVPGTAPNVNWKNRRCIIKR